MSTYDTAENIINDALAELGMPPANLAVGAIDANGYQALALLNALGVEILRAHDWQNLESVMNFTGDGVADRFPLPADFGRQINQTQWDTGDNRPLLGPTSPQVWSWCNYGIVAVGAFYRYRILDSEYAIFPVPSDGSTFALYYISKNWVIDADDPAAFKAKVTKAGDICRLDNRMLISGLKVKFWGAKGFDTTQLNAEFNYIFNNEKAQSQGARAISLSGEPATFLIGYQNVPEGTYYGG